MPAAPTCERLYRQVRNASARFGRSAVGVTAWREAGRTELTPRAVEKRLAAYVTALMNTLD